MSTINKRMEKLMAEVASYSAANDNPTCRFLAPPTVQIGDRYQIASGDEPLYADWDRAAHLPNYSTDIAAAWQVIEKAKEKFFHGGVQVMSRMQYRSCFQFSGMSPDGRGSAFYSVGKTAPLAICRAALKAVNSAA